MTFYLSGTIFRHCRIDNYLFGEQNDFFDTILHLSGLIVPKLSRVCRIFSKLLIASLSFRLSIRCFFRNFFDIYREFSETAGKIPKLESDRNESDFVIYWQIRHVQSMFSVNIFGHCPVKSNFIQNCPIVPTYLSFSWFLMQTNS